MKMVLRSRPSPPVVYPSYHRHYIVQQSLVHQSVPSMKVYGLSVMALEEVEGVHHVILITKQSPHVLLLFALCLGEVVGGYLTVFVHYTLCNEKRLFAVCPWVVPCLLARQAVRVHRVGHVEGRVHQYSVSAVQHFSIHAAHGRTYNQVRLLAVGHVFQQLEPLFWVQRYVWRHHRSLAWHILSEQRCRVRRAWLSRSRDST